MQSFASGSAPPARAAAAPVLVVGDVRGVGVSAGFAVAAAGPRRERSGKVRTAGRIGPRGGPQGRPSRHTEVLTGMMLAIRRS